MMKIQDIAFLLILAFLMHQRKPNWFAVAGLVSLLVSMPLFATWVFFTAERLTWYAAAFFLCAVVLHLVKK